MSLRCQILPSLRFGFSHYGKENEKTSAIPELLGAFKALFPGMIRLQRWEEEEGDPTPPAGEFQSDRHDYRQTAASHTSIPRTTSLTARANSSSDMGTNALSYNCWHSPH